LASGISETTQSARTEEGIGSSMIKLELLTASTPADLQVMTNEFLESVEQFNIEKLETAFHKPHWVCTIVYDVPKLETKQPNFDASRENPSFFESGYGRILDYNRRQGNI
jgi:hypothetical protein